MREMTDQERDAFLAEVRVAVLAIERDGKGPLAAPVWYRYRDGAFEVAMADASAKAHLLRKAGHGSLCIQDEGVPYRYVSAECSVSVDQVDDATCRAFLREVAGHYLGTERGDQYAENFPGHQEAIVTFTPRRWRTEVLG